MSSCYSLVWYYGCWVLVRIISRLIISKDKAPCSPSRLLGHVQTIPYGQVQGGEQREGRWEDLEVWISGSATKVSPKYQRRRDQPPSQEEDTGLVSLVQNFTFSIIFRPEVTLTIADELKRARAIAEIGPCTICTNKFQLSDQQGRVVFFMLSRLLLFQMESHLCRQTSGQTTWQGFRGRKRRRVSKYFTL